MSSEPAGPPGPMPPPPEAEAAPAGLEPVAGERRLHPAGIVVLAVRALRGLVLPLAILILGGSLGAGGGPGWRTLAYGAAGVVVAVAIGVAGWLTTRWSVSDSAIRVRTGVLSRRRTDVPLTRVQSLDTLHGPLQRLFRVQGVQVQTAGAGRAAEIVLSALPAADVERLRAAVRGGAAAAGTERAAEPPPLAERTLTRSALLVAALTSGQLGVVAGALAAVSQVFDDLPLARLALVPDTAIEWVLAGAGLLLGAWLLSILGAIVAFAGFTVSRDAHRLRIRRGLLNRRDATVPLARLQAVLVVEGLLRRPFGLAAVRVEVAGYAQEPAAAQTLFPLLRREEVPAFLEQLVPGLADGLGGLVPPPRRALRRYALPGALAGLLAGIALCFVPPFLWPWPLLLALPGAAHGWLRWRATGWRLRDGRLAIRSRRLARVTVLAPAARLQQHALRQTLLQRRARLADVTVRIGAGTGAAVRHVEAADAGRLFDTLAQRGAGAANVNGGR